MAEKDKPQSAVINPQAVQVGIDRPSMATNLEQRYKKSKIKERVAPVPVNFMSDDFVKGFILKQENTELLRKESNLKKGFQNEKYHG